MGVESVDTSCRDVMGETVELSHRDPDFCTSSPDFALGVCRRFASAADKAEEPNPTDPATGLTRGCADELDLDSGCRLDRLGVAVAVDADDADAGRKAAREGAVNEASRDDQEADVGIATPPPPPLAVPVVWLKNAPPPPLGWRAWETAAFAFVLAVVGLSSWNEEENRLLEESSRLGPNISMYFCCCGSTAGPPAASRPSPGATASVATPFQLSPPDVPPMPPSARRPFPRFEREPPSPVPVEEKSSVGGVPPLAESLLWSAVEAAALLEPT